MAKKEIFRVVTRAADGSLKIRDFHSAEMIFRTHSQAGVDDSSTDLDLRGMPIFKGLIGPIPEGKNIARYESHDVFEVMTKEWANAKVRRRRRLGSVESVARKVRDVFVATKSWSPTLRLPDGHSSVSMEENKNRENNQHK